MFNFVIYYLPLIVKCTAVLCLSLMTQAQSERCFSVIQCVGKYQQFVGTVLKLIWTSTHLSKERLRLFINYLKTLSQ